jgi:D-alanine-D-alanine ligase
MRVALAYDGPLDPADGGMGPDDLGAEYEDPSAIDSLLDAIGQAGHTPARLPVGVDFPVRARGLSPDLVFNVAEGIRGPMRESIVPAWLDHLRIPFTGSDGLTLAVTLDKALTKRLVAAEGVRTPACRLVSSLADLDGLDLDGPVFVKPNAEGSSMGIRARSKVSDLAELPARVEWVLRTYEQRCLVEQFVPGREFCVGILGNEDLHVLPIAEVRTGRDFYSYESKSRHDRQIVCPADVPDATAAELIDAAVKVYRAVRCRDLARLDFKLDAEGRASFIEVNPLPGLASAYSIFPIQARAGRTEYTELIATIIRLAARRGRPTEVLEP